jgi:all-trans-retinol 13,14-reductase
MAGKPPYVFASFPSSKDPSANRHTAELIIMVDGQSFETWKDTRWKQRPDDYGVVKDAARDGLVALTDSAIPGLASLIDYAEVATPATVEHFTSWPRGAFYGIPAIPQRYRSPWTQIETPIPGLLLTGTDVASHGILGAMMGGAFTAAKLLGAFGLLRVMRRFLIG